MGTGDGAGGVTLSSGLATTTAALATTTTVALTGPPTHWSAPRPAVEPSARADHAMVYDPGMGRVILLQGMDTADRWIDDMWTYDSAANTWTELHPTGDLPYRIGELAYDPVGDRVLLFADTETAGSLETNVFAYDPAADTWTTLATSGDKPAMTEGVVYDPGTGKFIFLWGCLSRDDSQATEYTNDFYAYDPASNAWEVMHAVGDAPSVRFAYAAVYDPVTERIILFGGAEVGGGAARSVTSGPTTPRPTRGPCWMRTSAGPALGRVTSWSITQGLA